MESNKRYWAMRTDNKNPEYFYSELKAGRMRQGWGYDKKFDLRPLYEFEYDEMDKEQADIYRRQWAMLEKEKRGMQIGDIVIIPHLPEYGKWAIAKIEGEYEFKISKKHSDYGHIRPVTLLNPDTPIDPNSSAVGAPLRSTMKCRLRLWNCDWYKDHIEKLIAALSEPETVTKRQLEKDKLMTLRLHTHETLWCLLQDNYQAGEFEKPCHMLFEQMYETVEVTAGPNEKGADFICRHTDPIGVTHRVAIQVKMYDWKQTEYHPINQLQQSFEHYENLTAGVLFNTTEGYSKEVRERAQLLEQKYSKPVILLEREDVLDLFMRYLPDILKVD